MNRRRYITLGIVFAIFVGLGSLGLQTFSPVGFEALAIAQPGTINSVGDERGEWILAYASPDNTDLLVDACHVLGLVVSGNSATNEPSEFGTSDGVIFGLKILSNFNLIEWQENHWVARDDASGEYQQFCPQSGSDS